MHWECKKFPAGRAGKFQGKEKTPTMIWEGVASHSLRIWHAYVDAPGALVNINVLNKSPLIQSLIIGMYLYWLYQSLEKQLNRIFWTRYWRYGGVHTQWEHLLSHLLPCWLDLSQLPSAGEDSLSCNQSCRKTIFKASGSSKKGYREGFWAPSDMLGYDCAAMRVVGFRWC